METIIGQTIDNYRIIEVLGRGGMGVVFKALDLNLEKIVALKMIDPFLARDENFLKRFKAEGKALAKLEDRNIVNVYALRETESGLFLVMEYVNAKNVSELIREKGKFSDIETILIAKQILNAIGCAHKANIIHRDIKPNNIMVCEDGTVKVMDFGIAKILQDAGVDNTVTRVAIGTLFYMSPEQIKGISTADVRNDIYAIGMTLYEMSTGRSPFEKNENEFTIQKQIVEGKIPTPSKFNPEINKKFEKFIMKALEKDASHRFQNIQEMQEALNQIEDGTTTQVQVRPKKSYKFLYVIIFAIVIGSSVLVYFLVQQKPEDEIINNRSIQTTNLIVKSNPPGAIVFIDNEVRGITNTVIESLKVKRYFIRLKKDGYEDWVNTNYNLTPENKIIDQSLKIIPVQNVSSSSDKKTTTSSTDVAAKLIAVKLSMDAQGKIYVDGNEYNVNPGQAIIEKVSPGKNSIKFADTKNNSRTFRIDVKEKNNNEVKCFFFHKVGINSTDSNGSPFSSFVSVDDIKKDEVPGEITLGPGSHKITVTKFGYHASEGIVTLKIEPDLKQNSYNLSFTLLKD